MSEVYILCEGYHDRAFWKGILLHLGCSDPGLKPDGSRKPINDPWSLQVKGGAYSFKGSSGKFIRVVPTRGRGNLLPLAQTRLKERDQKPVSHLIINCDSDQNADGSKPIRYELQFETVLQIAKGLDQNAKQTDAFTIAMDGGSTLLHSFPWKGIDPPKSGLPNQETMERLISAAIVSAYPARAGAVEDWLHSRPEPPEGSTKEHALSYLAGWYAATGSYDTFCEIIWKDPAIADQLKMRLEQSGYWDLIRSAVG